MRRLLLLLLLLLAIAAAGAFCPPVQPQSRRLPRLHAHALPLLLLHVAYDGSQYKAWKDAQDDAAPSSTPPNKKRKGHYAAHPPSLHTKLGTALSIIHSHAPLPSLALTPAIVLHGGVHAQAQLLSYHPPTVPFDGDLERSAHSLNRILPEDIRVLAVHPLPWPGFGLDRDLVQATYVYTVMLGPVHDPMLRHCAWLYTPSGGWKIDAGKEGVEVLVERMKAVAAAALGEKDREGLVLLQEPVIEAAWGPGVQEARARLIRFKMDVRPVDGHQQALVRWVGRVVRKRKSQY